MIKPASNLIKKISVLMLAILLVVSSCLAINSTPTECVSAALSQTESLHNGGGEVGMSIQSAFRLAYYKGEKITIGGSEKTDAPDLTNGKLYVVYIKGGEYKNKTVIMSEAYENNSASGDKLVITGFNTNQTLNQSEKNKIFTMTLQLTLDTGETFTLEQEYSIYATIEDLSSALSAVNILNKVNSILSNILTPIIIVVCSVGVIFAILLGVRMARANNAEEREEAKKRVIATIVAIAIGILLIIMFQVFARSSIAWFNLTDKSSFFEYMPSRTN